MIRKTRSLVAAVMVCCLASPAGAFVTPQDYGDVGVTLPGNAAVPAGLPVTDENGRTHAIGEFISRPSVLLFADYTCTTLCGPIVAFVASALEKSGLDAARQYRLIVIGLNPKDGATAAARMRREHLGDAPGLEGAATFVTASQDTVNALTTALGYRYAYDIEHDQYVHPGAAYVLRADGRVSRVLTGLGLSGGDMRLALVEAGEGRIGTFGDQVRLLCSGFDPAHGVYNLMVSRLLAGTAVAITLMLGGGIALLALAGRRRTACPTAPYRPRNAPRN
jgi:protein SCO1/2